MTTWNGQRIKKLRKSLGLTQKQFAEEIGAKKTTVGMWETDSYSPGGMPQKLLSIMEEKALYGADKP